MEALRPHAAEGRTEAARHRSGEGGAVHHREKTDRGAEAEDAQGRELQPRDALLRRRSSIHRSGDSRSVHIEGDRDSLRDHVSGVRQRYLPAAIHAEGQRSAKYCQIDSHVRSATGNVLRAVPRA